MCNRPPLVALQASPESRILTRVQTSAITLSAGPSPPRLAVLNCETHPILCSTWIAKPPSVWHIIPRKGDTTVRIIKLNSASTNVESFVKLHKENQWKDITPYEGIFHPFDGLLNKLYLIEPLGFIRWVFSIFPVWVLVIAVGLGAKNHWWVVTSARKHIHTYLIFHHAGKNVHAKRPDLQTLLHHRLRLLRRRKNDPSANTDSS